jgi:hypothetical protein
MNPPYVHRENEFDDFKQIRLLPQRRSWDGPACAVGDINNDDRQDLWIGGASGVASSLYLQEPDGTLKETKIPAFAADSAAEDVDGVLIDVDGDHDLDLVVASGGIELPRDSMLSGVRLYRNNGRGGFTRDRSALPDLFVRCGVITFTDVDGDGDQDLFVGARIDVDRYPHSPRSALLLNDGRGRFTDATDAIAPELTTVGMVSGAAWGDVDGDSDPDLTVVGEWMGVAVFENRSGSLKRMKSAMALDTLKGWWWSVAAEDVDGDGDLDLCVGNQGLNNRYASFAAHGPIRCRVADFDENGSLDPLITYMVNGKERVIRERMSMFSHMPTLNRTFNTYHQFASAEFSDFFDEESRDSMVTLEATTFSSKVLVNDGSGRFTPLELPWQAQLSPIRDWYFENLTGSATPEIIAIGNAYGAEAEFVRYDASRGVVLTQMKDGMYRAMSFSETGLSCNTDMRKMVSVSLPGYPGNGTVLFIFSNQSRVRAFVRQ